MATCAVCFKNATALPVESGRHHARLSETISADRLATEALKAMQSGHVNGLLVVEENGVLIGALNMHDY